MIDPFPTDPGQSNMYNGSVCRNKVRYSNTKQHSSILSVVGVMSRLLCSTDQHFFHNLAFVLDTIKKGKFLIELDVYVIIVVYIFI